MQEEKTILPSQSPPKRLQGKGNKTYLSYRECTSGHLTPPLLTHHQNEAQQTTNLQYSFYNTHVRKENQSGQEILHVMSPKRPRNCMYKLNCSHLGEEEGNMSSLHSSSV